MPVNPTGLRLYKKEKLCSVVAIGQLFGGNGADGIHNALVYPLRMVWRESPGRRSDAPVQFLVSVPKRRLRHAVDRVLMRRRIREAYRLLRHDYPTADGRLLDVVFIYVGAGLEPYARVERAMHRLLDRLSLESMNL